MKKTVEKPEKVSICRMCGGTGTVSRAVKPAPRFWGVKKRVVEHDVCPQCGGSGRVMVSAVIELDIRPYPGSGAEKEPVVAGN